MRRRPLRLALLCGLLGTGLSALSGAARAQGPSGPNTSPPGSPVKLVFIHHSTGENWLRDDDGGLGIALREAGYFVSDTNYGWGPADAEAGSGSIGDHTDTGNWWQWFSGPHRNTYLSALFAESDRHSEYARLASDPGGPNRIVLFKSCFPNARLGGSLADPVPPIGSNPLRGQDAYSDAMTLANAKGIYVEILRYFATRPDVLFVAVVNPPLGSFETDATEAANMRAMADWLVNEWLRGYSGRNVAVFDFYDVLTSNGGSTRRNDPQTNDLGWADGNHHRIRDGAWQHLKTVAYDMSAYAAGGDSHPTQAGNLKATGEFVPFLNAAYHCWQGDGGCPTQSFRCVAPGGSDASAGTLSAPWATIQHAADVLQPGETVLLRGGTYREHVVVSRSGSAGAELAFAAYPGETPVIDGTGLSLGEGLQGIFHVALASFVRVSGLTVRNAGPGSQDCGFLVENSAHVVLEQNVTDDTASSGIGVWGSQDVTLDSNEVIRACHGGMQEQISVGGTAGFVVVGNRVHDAGGTVNGGEGICLKDGSSAGRVHGNSVWNVPLKVGIYVDAWDKHTFDIEVDGNVVHDSIDGIGLASEMGGLLENIRVTNNVCYGNGYRGLFVGDYGGVATHPMNDLLVANNTFIGNGASGWGGGIAVDSREARGVIVRNNIVSGHPSFTILVSTALPAGALAVDHNLVDGFRGEEGETRGTGWVEGDPLFVDAAAHDYHLSAGSPALDAGDVTRAPAVDFDGVARPQGSGFDIGAFERPAGAGGTTAVLFVPVVVRTEGQSGSYFRSEMVLTNRGAGTAAIRYDYVGRDGVGSGSATASLGPRRQVVIGDAIDELRTLGVPIPASGNLVGTLRVTFSELASAADAAVTVRTTTPVPPASPTGAAGLAYAGIPLGKLPSGPVVLCGLRRDAIDRTNIAVQNAGGAGEGDITLRATLLSGASPYGPVRVEERTLGPGGFDQIPAPDGFFGCARVERTSGSAPFHAYAVINDNANSDGSFVFPAPASELGGTSRITLPVVVEASVFSSEVMLANLSGEAKRLRLGLHADQIGPSPIESFVDVEAGEQVSIPEFVQSLRNAGHDIPNPVWGPISVAVDGGSTAGLFAGARTSNPGDGGRYGLFYAGVPAGKASSSTAWICGLQQTATTRSNLALVNTGEVDGSSSDFLVEIWNGATGEKTGETTQTVGARRQVQINTVLTKVAPGTTNGYARITKTSGANPFIAYGVLNDGATQGSRSGDGAFVLSD